ncbi:ankyrin repeat domain-containing protein [Legionella gresilensis]|uniref:ankyrin repeat domain-containing protein n=1 Tax=Legionella gresilensis TaxID=91823 RepID=UPI0013EF9375|nr:ankyrin repeat domain-containing protein [Legionella gresilensis]
MLTSQEYCTLSLKLNCLEQVILKLDAAIQAEAQETLITARSELDRLSQALSQNDGKKAELLAKKVESELRKLFAIMQKGDNAILLELLLTEIHAQLHCLIAKGDVEGFTNLLEMGKKLLHVLFNLDREDPQYKTLLCHAIERGQLEIATLLLENKASLGNKSPLIIPIKSQKIEFIDLLMRSGANVNGTSWDEDLLKQAIKSERSDVVKFLCDYGAEVDIYEMVLAFKSKNSAIIQTLFNVIKRNANLFQVLIDDLLRCSSLEFFQIFLEISHSRLNKSS